MKTTNMTFIATVTGVPLCSTNNKNIRSRNGTIINSEEYRTCKKDLTALFLKRNRANVQIKGKSVVTILVDTAKDIDNVLKVILDSLQAAKIIKNDKSVCGLRVVKKSIKKGMGESFIVCVAPF